MNQAPRGIVVDDRPKAAEGIVKVLTKLGFSSRAFADPDDALQFASEHRGSVELAIFDFYLREKSGADYARIFREQELSSHIVLVTGYAIVPELAQELKRLGVSVYERPVDWESLLSEKLGAWRTTTTSEEIALQQTPPVIPSDTLDDDIKPVTVFPQPTPASPHESLVVRLMKWQNALGALAIVLAALAVLVAIAIAKGWFSAKPSIADNPLSTSPSVKTMHLVIAEGTQPVAAPVYVAYEKHFWKDIGLDVELVSFTSGRLCLDAVLAGKANAGTMAETPIMNAALQGSPISVVAGIHKSQKNTKVIARKDKGVVQASDLKGRRVGVSIGTNGEFFMDKFLTRNNLTRKDLQVVDLQPEYMGASLSRGEVDACFTWEPHIQNAKKQLGDAAVIFSNDGIYTETYNIVTTPSFAKSNAKELTLLLQGLDKAIAYIHENPDDAIGIVSRRIGMEASLLKAVWPDYTFQLSLEESFLNLLKEEAEWAKASGIAPPNTEIPNYRRFILTEPLKAIRPEAVMIK